jgi:hypothetical protein
MSPPRGADARGAVSPGDVTGTGLVDGRLSNVLAETRPPAGTMPFGRSALGGPQREPGPGLAMAAGDVGLA